LKYIDTKTRTNRVVSLNDELDEFMKYIGLDAKMQDLQIFRVWNECVGEAIAMHSTPVDIKKNKLFVSVENAVWRFELTMRKNDILEKINGTLAEAKVKKTIKEIIFV
jgi:predicted nucleic acid-binding Zn ribbon protein